MSRAAILITDEDLDRLAAMSSANAEAWRTKHCARLHARGVAVRVPDDARVVLARNDNRYTWTGDVRG